MGFHRHQLRRYGRVFALTVVAVYGLSGLFNLVVDPYWVFAIVEREGFNAKKSAYHRHVATGSTYIVQRKKPAALILGISRAKRGLDPGHPGWDRQPVYNLGIPGAPIYQISRHFQHADAGHPVEQVVLALDFMAFNALLDPTSDFDEARLASVRGGGRPIGWYGDMFRFLFSGDALRASILTLLSQKEPLRYLPDGRELIREKGRQGVRQTFKNKLVFYLSGVFLRGQCKEHRFDHPDGDKNSLSAFRDILELAYSRNIDMRMLISPNHAWMAETISILGLWPQFESWKRQLVNINEAVAKEHGAPPFPLWDFSGYTSLTMEQVPPKKERDARMTWHQEPSHYKVALGNLVLDRVFGYNHPERTVPDDIGNRLTGSTIEAHLEQVREKQRQYRQEHPSDIREITELFQRTAPSRVSSEECESRE